MSGRPTDKSKLASHEGAGKAYDYMLDPVPVPDAVESDSDTAWGLWELTQNGDPQAGVTKPAALSSEEFPHTKPDALDEPDALQKDDFLDQPTVPMGLDEIPPLKRK